jgi:glycyl-tRNA synthetase
MRRQNPAFAVAAAAAAQHTLQARRMLEKRLPVPAYDMLLKCSHAFNVLDARGAVGVTERADCFARMRALAREVTGV